MTTDNEPIYVPKVGERVRVTAVLKTSTIDERAKLEVGRVGVVRHVVAHDPGLHTERTAGYCCVYLDDDMLTEWCRVAPASLAAEQKPFEVGDWVSGESIGRFGRIVGTYEPPSEFNVHHRVRVKGDECTCALAKDHVHDVQQATLRHESPPPAKRPECDACGKESCDSRFGQKTARYEGLPCCRDLFGDFYLCAACWTRASGDNANSIRERRKQIASGSVGSVDAATRKDAEVMPSRHCGHPSTQPSEPGRPCVGCETARSGGAFLSTGDEGRVECLDCGKVSVRNDDAIAAIMMRRDAALPTKRRQALDQLLRPADPPRGTLKVGYEAGQMGRCGRTVSNGAPPSWPEDAWIDAGSCEP